MFLLHLWRKSKKLPRASRIPSPWHPAALRTGNLIFAIALSLILVAGLQVLLAKGNRDGGILFATDINKLPLAQSFWYLYFPTILAVIFSTYWTWIDLDAKRYEPYRQLLSKGGALGKDSIFLEYPFSFMPFVPFYAFKRRHWLVFWASLATVLTMFGIVPAQAGIFSTRNVTRVIPMQFAPAQDAPAAAFKFDKIISPYTLSTYSIAMFNERLPPWMTRNYTLRPFSRESSDQASANWTAQTTLYGVDLQCEVAKGPTAYASGWLVYRSGPCVYANYFHSPSLIRASFAVQNGTRYNERNLRCNTYNHSFFASLSRKIGGRVNTEDATYNVTAIFCRADYFQQSVMATVDGATKKPLSFDVVGSRENLSGTSFNLTAFDIAMNDQELPLSTTWKSLAVPNAPRFKYGDEGRYGSLDDTPFVSAIAIAMEKRLIEEYFDVSTMMDSYRQAYKLVFSRAMNEALKTNVTYPATVPGTSTYTLESVVLEPVFTNVVTSLLSMVALCAAAALYISFRESRSTTASHLTSDPGTVAAVMSLVAEDDRLLSRFAKMEKHSLPLLAREFGKARFGLSNSGIVISQEPESDTLLHKGTSPLLGQYASPIRPTEFHLGVALAVLSVFATLIFTLAALFSKARLAGLALPSSNKLLQNLVRSYLPTAIATSIEPMWVLVNRLLCMLQPMQELLALKATPRQSIDRNYSSLPPQLTMFRALRSKHYVLASVCAMALLANVLATAFAGLLFQDSMTMAKTAQFRSFQNVNINRTNTLYPGQWSKPHIIIADSNFTQGTSLPPWTDKHHTYVPISTDPPPRSLTVHSRQAQTIAFGANLDCKEITFGSGNTLNMSYSMLSNEAASLTLGLNLSLPNANGRMVNCRQMSNAITWSVASGSPNNTACMLNSAGTEFSINFDPPNKIPAYLDKMTDCTSSIILGWVRFSGASLSACSARNVFQSLAGSATPVWTNGSRNATVDLTIHAASSTSIKLVQCMPKFTVGKANISFDENGYITEPVRNYQPEEGTEKELASRYLTNTTMDLTAIWMKYMEDNEICRWHEDNYTSSRFHYFMLQESNDTRLTDVSQPLPRLADITYAANAAYAKLFAVWLGLNTADLISSRTNTSMPIEGRFMYTEERLFFNKPLFIVSEVILGLYIIVAILVYASRPAKFLTRLPTSIGAIISLVAASTAVRELKGTAHFSTEERAEFLEKEGHVFGYGSYLGGDGAVHVGIERAPFVSRAREVEVEVQKSTRFSGRYRWLGVFGAKYRVVGQEGEESNVRLERLK